MGDSGRQPMTRGVLPTRPQNRPGIQGLGHQGDYKTENSEQGPWWAQFGGGPLGYGGAQLIGQGSPPGSQPALMPFQKMALKWLK